MSRSGYVLKWPGRDLALPVSRSGASLRDGRPERVWHLPAIETRLRETLFLETKSHGSPGWNHRLWSGVQCILLATRGKVGTQLDFFEAAFGRTTDELIEIAMMPEEYIINRRRHELNGAAEWRDAFRALTNGQRARFMEIACETAPGDVPEMYAPLLAHYAARPRRRKGQV